MRSNHLKNAYNWGHIIQIFIYIYMNGYIIQDQQKHQYTNTQFSFLSCTYTTENEKEKEINILQTITKIKCNLSLLATTHTITALNCTLIIRLNLMLMAGVNPVPFLSSIPPYT